MKLDIHKPQVVAKSRSHTHNWSIETQSNLPQQELQPSVWVKLLALPNPFSFDEALLLCQCSENEWLAWVPDYGETVLGIHQFCLNC